MTNPKPPARPIPPHKVPTKGNPFAAMLPDRWRFAAAPEAAGHGKADLLTDYTAGILSMDAAELLAWLSHERKRIADDPDALEPLEVMSATVMVCRDVLAAAEAAARRLNAVAEFVNFTLDVASIAATTNETASVRPPESLSLKFAAVTDPAGAAPGDCWPLNDPPAGWPSASSPNWLLSDPGKQ